MQNVALTQSLNVSVQFDGKYPNFVVTANVGSVGGVQTSFDFVAARGGKFGPLIATNVPLARQVTRSWCFQETKSQASTWLFCCRALVIHFQEPRRRHFFYQNQHHLFGEFFHQGQQVRDTEQWCTAPIRTSTLAVHRSAGEAFSREQFIALGEAYWEAFSQRRADRELAPPGAARERLPRLQ